MLKKNTTVNSYKGAQKIWNIAVLISSLPDNLALGGYFQPGQTGIYAYRIISVYILTVKVETQVLFFNLMGCGLTLFGRVQVSDTRTEDMGNPWRAN